MIKKTKSNPKGAGRPQVDPYLKKVPFNIRLPVWLVEFIREQDESQSEVIEKSIISHYNLK